MPIKLTSVKSLIPTHTIAGKLLSGDKEGALKSAQNYIKSGELATDIKNVGIALTTGNVSNVLAKASGMNSTGTPKTILNKGANLTTLKPTPVQQANANQAQTEANIALAVGSGVPASQANLIGGASYGMTANDNGVATEGNTTKPSYGWLILGAGALLLMSKKGRTYVRKSRVYRKARRYTRRTYSRAMSYYRRRK